MSLRHTTFSVVSLLVLVTAYCVVSPLGHSQVPIAKSKAKVEQVINFMGDVANGATVQIRAVPADKKLRITDVIFCNDNPTTDAVMNIRVNGTTNVMSVLVTANSCFHHSFATALEFDGGQVVQFQEAGTGISVPIAAMVTGYIGR